MKYLITPTLPSLKESCRTFILASCLWAFETDISRSDIIFVLWKDRENQCEEKAKPVIWQKFADYTPTNQYIHTLNPVSVTNL